jgi:hypothetical protein
MEYMNSDDLNRELDAVSATGATWLRVLVDWNKIEPTKGEYDWGYLDGIVSAAGAHNLKVLGVITYTAQWARPPDTYYTFPAVNPADYGDFATAVVQRYADRVSHWELWNEPNLPVFVGWLPHAAPQYAALVKAAYPAIKAVQPDSTVILAGLCRQPASETPPEFLQLMYDEGLQGFFDAAAAHPYVFPGGLAADTRSGWSDMIKMRDIMVAHGDGDKKIWLTELGAPTSDPAGVGVSQEEQAKQITEVLAAAAKLPFSGPAFIYSIRDTDTSSRDNKERNMGALLTSDWQPKVAAAALARQ